MNNPVHLLEFAGFNSVKPILQTEAAECGLACIAMIANYYGHKIDLNTLRRQYPISLKGATLQCLIATADKLHMASRPLKVDLDHLKDLKTPCVLHWDMNHFVVLKKVSRNKVTIIDPAVGERVFSVQEFSKHFTGIALELTATKKFIKKDEVNKLKLSELWNKITGLKRSLLQVLVLSLLMQVFIIVTPFYVQLAIDDVVVSQDVDLMLILAIGFLLIMLFQVCVTALRSLVILIMGTQMNFQIANNLFRHLLRLPQGWFEKRHIGDIVSRFGSLDSVKELLTTGTIEALVDGVMIIGTLVMMYIYSPTLAWLVVATALIYCLIRMILFKPFKNFNEENIVANAKEDSNFMETVRASQTIKLYRKEVERQTVWQNLYADTMNTGIKLEKLNIGFTSANKLLFGIENIIVIYLAATNIIAGIMTVGMLFAFIAYKQQFTMKAISLIDKFIQFRMLSLHLTRIGDIALTPTEKDFDQESNPFIHTGNLKGSLRLDNISFRYAADEPLLFNNASIRINAGESVAIVGASGCGKSTLMKIMLGLIEADNGQVMIDGININKLGSQNYRGQIAAVMQNDQLLSGSIADNICFFAPEYDQKEIERCARMASVHDDIMAMPMNYNTLIGDMGSTLSGGQKQRIILARALYKKPKILFLDEATSHLDIKLENKVNTCVKNLNMTRVIIAHRKETILSADRIFRVTQGKIIELRKARKSVPVPEAIAC
ncbi:MAG: peptidase domain-containing ABC transporter [Gammaproteobacteria bacterium]|nr:peptidase domain-containing ABC transporter [Gammaproteobacteria bacterium]